MSKQKQSKLDQFAERLDEWELKGLTLDQIAGELHEAGCDVSCSRLSCYLARRREASLQERMFTSIATGGRMNRELDAAYAKNPAPAIEQLIRISKTLIMSLQVQGAADPKSLSLANAMQQTVLEYLSGKTKAELELRKLGLQERKVALLEKRAAQADAAEGVLKQNISPEEQAKRLREIFKR